MNKMHMRKLILGVAVILGIVFCGNVMTSKAEEMMLLEGINDTVTEEAMAALLDADYPDNDELFACYVDAVFYGTLDEATEVEIARNQLTEPSKAIYDYYKPIIGKIARGEESSTVIIIDEETFSTWGKEGKQPVWTAQELGADSITEDNVQEVVENLKPKIKELLCDYSWRALMHDCPYEMYWHDKSLGIRFRYNVSYSSECMMVTELTCRFEVARSYRPDGAADETYLTDTTKTGATSLAVQNAKNLVAEHQTEGDYYKLKNYCDEIQALSEYNDAAAEDDYSGGYGDPWQLIYVFDGNPETKVVCEGFSKAFQYLCDVSEFQNEGITCYSVSGYMNGGRHMWNTVTMGNGKNYLVDVTNHTSTRNLFLVGTPGHVLIGYPFTFGSRTITFEYYDETKKLWGTSDDSILCLAPSNYSVCTSSHAYPAHWEVETEPTREAPGVLTKTCKDCGEMEEMELPYLKFKSASLSLHSNLTVNYKVADSFFEEAGYENPYVVFNFRGEETVVSDYTVVSAYPNEGYLYVFPFSNVAANQMTDTITATIYATYDGRLYEGRTQEYSVITYCYGELGKDATASNTKLRTLLVDLLNYGAAAQVYSNYRTETLANANMTEEVRAWASQSLPELVDVLEPKYATVAEPTAKWRGAALRMGDAVEIRYKLETEENINELTVQLTSDSGKTWTIPGSQFVQADGVYYVYFKGLNAAEMSEPVYATVYKAGEPISNTVRYSIESYVYGNQNTSDQALKNMIINMMKYGKAAYSYIH